MQRIDPSLGMNKKFLHLVCSLEQKALLDLPAGSALQRANPFDQGIAPTRNRLTLSP